jgi:hypothetical protein
MRFRALSPRRIQIRGKSHAANVASERGRAAELRRTRARRDDQMHRLTPSTTRFTCRLPNASMNSAIFWNGWPTPSRRTNRQSARKSTAIGEASATYRQSAPLITCCRKCLSPRDNAARAAANTGTNRQIFPVRSGGSRAILRSALRFHPPPLSRNAEKSRRTEAEAHSP